MACRVVRRRIDTVDSTAIHITDAVFVNAAAAAAAAAFATSASSSSQFARPCTAVDVLQTPASLRSHLMADSAARKGHPATERDILPPGINHPVRQSTAIARLHTILWSKAEGDGRQRRSDAVPSASDQYRKSHRRDCKESAAHASFRQERPCAVSSVHSLESCHIRI